MTGKNSLLSKGEIRCAPNLDCRVGGASSEVLRVGTQNGAS